MKYKNIAISGKNIASGSTTLANKLTKKLGWKFYSAGEMFRQYCNEKGWPIERYKDVPDRVDIELDEKAKKILETKEKIIYEGWLVGWISRDMSHVFKILCTAPLKTRIKRFANRERVGLKEARKKVIYRDKTTLTKHKRLYNISNRFDKKYFDLVLNTSKLTPEEEVKEVLKYLK